MSDETSAARQALHAIEEAIKGLELQRLALLATLPARKNTKAAHMPKPWMLRQQLPRNQRGIKNDQA